MLYVQQSLGPDEELVHIGQFHWIYTIQAFFAIVWGVGASIAIIAGAIFVYKEFGYYPQNLPLLDSVKYLHPGIRIFAFVMFVLGLLSFAQMMIIKATTEIAITNNRLVFKKGLVARHVGEISIDRIEGVNVLQSFLGRIFNYGRIAVRGMGVGEVVLPSIDDPIAFRKAIERARKL
ncbi:MAG: PH domain-containing protein [Alphaproteobacteria bacterium]|nr:PH domain-containing protein [Alphaproteobacteria bacterium]MCD8570817.1 PH domain-containing protein [Alphaproteobacteria bacterium]